MNLHSPEQHYPLSIVEIALGRCLQERENAEFLIETKQPVSYTHLTLPTNREV